MNCNPLLVDAANNLLSSEGFEPMVAPAPRDGWPDDGRSYDSVVVGWGSYTLMQGRARRVAFLREARARTGPGDPLLVSFFELPQPTAYFTLVRALAGPLRRVRGQEVVEPGDTLRPNFVHYFSRPELEAELVEGGFEPVWFASEPYAHAVALAQPR